MPCPLSDLTRIDDIETGLIVFIDGRRFRHFDAYPSCNFSQVAIEHNSGEEGANLSISGMSCYAGLFSYLPVDYDAKYGDKDAGDGLPSN